MQTKASSWLGRNLLLGREGGCVVGLLDPDNAVTRVAANFSRMEFRSSDVTCGEDVEVDAVDEIVGEWVVWAIDVVREVDELSRANFAAS